MTRERVAALALARVRGVTLVELLVVLTLVSLLLGLSTLAFGRLRPEAQPEYVRRLARAHAESIRRGVEILTTDSTGLPVRFLPDGRALKLRTVRLHGAVDDAQR